MLILLLLFLILILTVIIDYCFFCVVVVVVVVVFDDDDDDDDDAVALVFPRDYQTPLPLPPKTKLSFSLLYNSNPVRNLPTRPQLMLALQRRVFASAMLLPRIVHLRAPSSLFPFLARFTRICAISLAL